MPPGYGTDFNAPPPRGGGVRAPGAARPVPANYWTRAGLDRNQFTGNGTYQQQQGPPHDINQLAQPNDINQLASGRGGAPKPAPSPLDASYYANVASNQFKVNNQVNALNQAGSYATTDLQAALAKLGYQQPRDELRLEQGANNRGGLYSSVYGQQLGDLNYNYAGRAGGIASAFSKGAAGRANQIAGLLGSLPLYQNQQYADAVLRASAAAQKNPATGESGAPLVRGGGGNRGRLAKALADKNAYVGPG